jgi:hypothetical protein
MLIENKIAAPLKVERSTSSSFTSALQPDQTAQKTKALVMTGIRWG